MAAREIRRQFDYARRMILIVIEDSFHTLSHLQIQIQSPEHPEPDVPEIIAAHLSMLDRSSDHFSAIAQKHQSTAPNRKA